MFEREVHRDVRHADRPGGYPGVRAHVLGRLERLLEDPVEHRAGGAARLGGGVGLLHLAEDLVLADELRVEAARDLEEVQRGVPAREPDPDLLELGQLEMLPRAVGGLHGVGRRLVGADAVELDPVARGQYRDLAEPRHARPGLPEPRLLETASFSRTSSGALWWVAPMTKRQGSLMARPQLRGRPRAGMPALVDRLQGQEGGR